MGYFTAWCCVQVSVSTRNIVSSVFPHSLAVTSIPPPRFTFNFAAAGYRLRQEQFGHSLALDWQLFLWVDFILFASFVSYSSFLFTVPSSFESSLVQGLKCFNNANFGGRKEYFLFIKERVFSLTLFFSIDLYLCSEQSVSHALV